MSRCCVRDSPPTAWRPWRRSTSRTGPSSWRRAASPSTTARPSTTGRTMWRPSPASSSTTSRAGRTGRRIPRNAPVPANRPWPWALTAESGPGGTTLSPTKPAARIALVLGGGAARGWAHIGVIRKLRAHNIPIHAVCGSSIGALVGGAFAAGHLEALADWVQALDRVDVVRLLDPTLVGGGFIQGTRLMEVMVEFVPSITIEELEIPFACTATDLRSGREIWIREGSLSEAVRASIALPGLFTPVRR